MSRPKSRIPLFECRGRGYRTSQNAITETRGKARDLILYSFGVANRAAIRNVTVSPCNVAPRRRTSGVKEKWLPKEDADSFRVKRTFRLDNLFERATDVDWGSTGTL